jgi:hypothetical protein
VSSPLGFFTCKPDQLLADAVQLMLPNTASMTGFGAAHVVDNVLLCFQWIFKMQECPEVDWEMDVVMLQCPWRPSFCTFSLVVALLVAGDASVQDLDHMQALMAHASIAGRWTWSQGRPLCSRQLRR